MPSAVYRISRDIARVIVPPRLYARIKWWWWSRPKPDRRYMQREILPALARLHPGRVLFVGTQEYTVPYRRYFRRDCEYWTMDLDPAAAAFGAPGRHKTASVTEVDRQFDAEFFDVVLLNGVFGFGVDDAATQAQTLKAISKILKPGGVLLLGWNNDLMNDPLAPGRSPQGYEHIAPAPLPARKQFEQCTHVYDFLRKL